MYQIIPKTLVSLKSHPDVVGYLIEYDPNDALQCRVAYWCNDPEVNDILEFTVPRKALVSVGPVECNRNAIEIGDLLVFPSAEKPKQCFTSLQATSIDDSATVLVGWFTSKGVFKQKELPLLLLVPVSPK